MENLEVLQQLDLLSKKQLEEVVVSREDFLAVCNYITKREDFKHFRGAAKHGGETVYTYLDTPRS